MKIRILVALGLATMGVRTINAQCYTFSSGAAASLTVNITHLSPPTQSTTVPWIYHYSSDSGLVANVSLKVGQTVYTPDSNSVAPLIDISVGDDLSSSFSSMDFNVAFSSPNNIIAGGLASAYWNGNYFPNGSLPATLPALSGAHDPILIVNVIGTSGTIVDQTLTLTSISSCSNAPPPQGGSPSRIIPASGASQSAVVGTTFASPLQATVTDSSGNPLSGVAQLTGLMPSAGLCRVLRVRLALVPVRRGSCRPPI